MRHLDMAAPQPASLQRLRDGADYLVLGGGTAGCILASRLASRHADRDVTVMVLEAGQAMGELRGDAASTRAETVPALSAALRDGGANWRDETTPQKEVCGRSMLYDRGKILGGSSLLNFQVWTRGPRADYDLAARVTGDSRWAWDNVLPIFKELERWDPTPPEGMEAHVHYLEDSHPPPLASGEVGVSFNQSWAPHLVDFLDACRERGHNACKDFNCGDCIGYGVGQYSVLEGKRSSSARSFLKSAPSRLTVATDVLIDRVVFDDDRRAIGVDVLVGGESVRVACRREVAVCAGTIATPAILQRSGVGDPRVLAPLGIPTVSALPDVGRHLDDHPRFPVIVRTREGIETHDSLRLSAEKKEAAMRQYERDGTGLLSSVASGPALWLRFPDHRAWPEYATLSAREKAQLDEPLRPHAEILAVSAFTDRTSPLPAEGNHVTLVSLLQNAQSRGRVTIRSRDANVPAELDLAMFEHALDRRLAIETVREMLALASTHAYRRHVAADFVVAPRGAVLDAGLAARAAQPAAAAATCPTLSDEAIWDHLRDHSDRGYHATATARMGREGQAEGYVVDTEFRVLGVRGLRVGDLSVWPSGINAHTQALAYLIGHRCACAIIDGAAALAARAD